MDLNIVYIAYIYMQIYNKNISMDPATHKPKKVVNSQKKKVGKFVLDFSKQLGSGQFGKVYVAQNTQTKQEVAVKTIKKGQMYEDKYTKDALVREIEIMRNLKSPNIIQFIQISETPNNIYIFQELANNGTLDDLLNKNKRFQEKVALEYIVQILTGFAQLIKHGIIHRDIKPTNLLIKDKVIKIADFGMSRYSGKMSFMQSFVGTPFYMAPQILANTKYSYKCDIWSLGVLFYQLITGSIPWKLAGNSGINDILPQIEKQCQHGVQFPVGLKISNNYKEFVNGCLKYDEKDRFDWQQVLGHRIFEGKLTHTSGIDSFTLTELRLKIHCNNLNLQKIISKLPEKLTKQDFTNFLMALNEQITATQAANLFKLIVKDKDNISLDEIMKYLENHGIKRGGLKGKEVPEIQKAMQAIMQRIAKGIEEKKIDLFDLYKKFDKNKQNKLFKEQFQSLVQSICSDITVEEIDKMFLYFNGGQHKKSIAFETFYESFCKAVQVPALKDQKVSQGIKKMEERKRGH